jgi:hypothetical protein
MILLLVVGGQRLAKQRDVRVISIASRVRQGVRRFFLRPQLRLRADQTAADVVDLPDRPAG